MYDDEPLTFKQTVVALTAFIVFMFIGVHALDILLAYLDYLFIEGGG